MFLVLLGIFGAVSHAVIVTSIITFLGRAMQARTYFDVCRWLRIEKPVLHVVVRKSVDRLCPAALCKTLKTQPNMQIQMFQLMGRIYRMAQSKALNSMSIPSDNT
jgi:hypothetical protein